MDDRAASVDRGAPKVTIVLPTFNETAGVIDCCAKSILKQTLEDFECLVIDDSTDEASRLAWDRWQSADPRIRHVVPKTRLGLAGSLNVGICKANGEYIARVDTDDPSLPDRLEREVSYLDDNRGVDIVGCALVVVNQDRKKLGERLYPARHRDIVSRMLWSTGIAHPAVLARREAFFRYGFYDESFPFAEDLELWLRWLVKGAIFANLPEPLVLFELERTGRSRHHWRYNMRARLKNLRRGEILKQSVGVAFAGIALCLPPPLVTRLNVLIHCRSWRDRIDRELASGSVSQE